MAYITTDYMPLKLPVPGSREPAQIALINENMTLLSGHDHSLGEGLPVAVLRSGLAGNRPTAGEAGSFWFSTDSGLASLDTGSRWVDFLTSAAVGQDVIDPIVRDTLRFGPEGTTNIHATLHAPSAGNLTLDGVALITQASGDARYLLKTQPYVVTVNGRSGAVTLTAADVGALTQAAADGRYVNAAGDNVLGDLSIQSKYVRASAAEGNSLVWNTDGFFVPDAGQAPDVVFNAVDASLDVVEPTPSTFDARVRLSADAGNVLALRANGLYSSGVVGPGLANDPLADIRGDLFVATGPDQITRLGLGGDGQVLTVDAADPLGVTWQDPPAGGGGGGLDQATADALYVNVAGDAMTGALNAQGIGSTSPTIKSSVGQEANPHLQVLGDGTVQWGPGGATAVDTSLQRIGAGDLALDPKGRLWLRGADGVAGNRSLLSSTPAGLLRWSLDLGNGDALTGSNNGARFVLARWADDGNFLGTPLVIDRATGTVSLTPGAAQPALNANSWIDIAVPASTQILRGFVAGTQRFGFDQNGTLSITPGGTAYAADLSGDIMVRGKAVNLANAAFSASAGWQFRSDNQGLGYIYNGAQTGTFFGNTDGTLIVRGTVNISPGTENLAGEWLSDPSSVRKAFVGLEGDYINWRVYGNTGTPGNRIAINTTTGAVTVSGTLNVSGMATFATGVHGNGSVFQLSSTANIQLNPSGNIVHPGGHNTQHIGWQGLNWATCYANNVRADGQLNVIGGFHLILTSSNGGWIYHRSTGHTFFDGSAGGVVAPELDNKLASGNSANRWTIVYAVNGGINTCRAEEKDIVGLVDPDEALEAVLNTPIKLFHPKSEAPQVRELLFAGIVDDSADPRMQIGPGSQTAATHQAAMLMAAVQSLAAQVDALKARLPA